MLSRSEQAALNLEDARSLRASGASYRQIRRQLGLSAGQLGLIRRALSREKGAATRLRSTVSGASERDLPVGRSVLPKGLRRTLMASGYQTLGDVADGLADPAGAGLEAIAGVGPYKAALVKRLLDHYGLLPGAADLKGEIEKLFPDLA